MPYDNSSNNNVEKGYNIISSSLNLIFEHYNFVYKQPMEFTIMAAIGVEDLGQYYFSMGVMPKYVVEQVAKAPKNLIHRWISQPKVY